MIHKRRPRRKRNELDHGLIITSMVDMFTLVLLFLLVFYDPAYQSDDAMALPNASVVHAVEQGASVRITTEAVLVAGQRVAAIERGVVPAGVARDGAAIVPVIDALTKVRAATPPVAGTTEPVLLVECDKRVAWIVLRGVLESAAKAGYPRYRFVVLGGE